MMGLFKAILSFLLAGLATMGCSGQLLEKAPSIPTQVIALDHLAVQPGDVITVTGKNLKDDILLSLGEDSLELIVLDAKTATFALPSSLSSGVLAATFTLKGKVIGSFPLVNAKNPEGLPTLSLSPEEICSDVAYKTVEGSIRQGLRVCDLTIAACDDDKQSDCETTEDFPSAELEGLAEKVPVGQILLGVSGTFPPRPADCAADGDANCAIPESGTLKAVAAADLLPNNIRINVTLGGVVGSMSPDLCTSEGQTNCVASLNFPTVDSTLSLSANASKMRAGLTIMGVTGGLQDCSIDGASSCVVIGPSHGAAKISGSSSKILSGQTIAGIVGTAPLRPQDCAADGSTDCVTVASYPAVSKTNLSSNTSKILSSLTLAGVTGTINNCSSEGATSCKTVSNYPAISKSLVTSNAAKFRSSLTIASVAGTLANCSVDGGVACVATGSFAAIDKSSAAPKIATGQTLSGIAGSGAGKPLDCSLDGAIACTSVSSFPAIDGTAAAPKIVSGETLASIVGTGLGRPGDCSTDGGTDCVTLSGFPAVDKSVLTTNAAKFSSTLTLASVAGTLNACNSDGQSGCQVLGPDYAAALLTGADAKITSGKTLAGVAGTAPSVPANCSADAATSCVTTGSFPAAQLADAASKIVLGQTLAGALGTASGARPADCSSDSETSCVTTPAPNYPAMKVAGAAAKIADGVSLGGVPGTAAARPLDCSTDGGTNCVAVAAFPAIDKNQLVANAAKFLPTLTIGSVPGTLPDCSTDGGTACLTVTSYPSVKVLGLAAKVLSGQTVAGVSGIGAGRPAECAADGAVSCTSVSAFPALNKSLLQANANKLRSSYSLSGVTGTLADCALDGATGCVAVTNFPAAAKSTAAAKILNGQTLAGVSGTAAVRPADCSADGSVDCVAVTNFPAIDKTALTAAVPSIRSSLTLAGIAGTLANCTNDGQGSCYATGSYLAADTNGAAAKILSGQTLAGVHGSASLRPSDCSTDAGTACVTVANYPSVNLTALTAAAGNIKSTVTLASVTGSMNDCATDGGTSCRAITNYPALLKSGADAKILTGSTLGGVNGSAPLRPADCTTSNITACVTVASHPSIDRNNVIANVSKMRTSINVLGNAGTMADCSTDNGTSCFTTSSFPSVVKANVTEGLIKSGQVIAGVTGLYPNSSYRLSSGANPDLTQGTFATKILSSSAFSYYDRAGTRYDGAGDADIVATNILTSQSIFSTAGSLVTVANCSSEAQVGCAAISPFKSVNAPTVEAYAFRANAAIANVPGRITNRRNSINLVNFDRTSGNGAATGADFYDSIDDTNNYYGFSTFPAPGALPLAYVQDYWPMVASYDDGSGSGGIAGNGICDGTEWCGYTDKLTGLRWWWADGTARSWEDAITVCNGWSGWRLPTQKEAYQLYINGASWLFTTQARIKAPTNSWPWGRIWTATTASWDVSQAWWVELYTGAGLTSGKTDLNTTWCVYP